MLTSKTEKSVVTKVNEKYLEIDKGKILSSA